MNKYAPVIAMIHNAGLNRWHPVLFLESPLPGPDSIDKPVRHKSTMHHTTGFATREEALASIPDLHTKVAANYGEPRESLDGDFEWDGVDIPSMTEIFTEDCKPCLHTT